MTYNFAPTPLVLKLQEEVLKFNDICESRSSPETDLGTNVLNLENRSFEKVSERQFFSIVTFK